MENLKNNNPVYLLHLETATKVCSVALSCDGKLVQLAEIADDDYAHGEQLTLLISKVLDWEGILPAHLSAVSVTAGPGSYTGLRIGVSTAKGLCYALQVPLISIDSLVSMAHLALQKYPEKVVCPMIDARRMEVFSAIYSPELEVLKPISADVLDETTYHDFEPFVYFGDGALKMKALWNGTDKVLDPDLKPSAKGQISLAYTKFLHGEIEDVAYFEPLYVKEFYQAPSSKKN